MNSFLFTIVIFLMVCISLIGFDEKKFIDNWGPTLEKAELGDRSAQAVAGHWYTIAFNSTQNGQQKQFFINEAIRWLTLASDQNDTSSTVSLANIWSEGKGVPQDTEYGIRLYKKAVVGGSATAAMRLGHIYEYGNGVEKSDEESIKWVKVAFENLNKEKHADDIEFLAVVTTKLAGYYLFGTGVKKDLKKAVFYFSKAAEKGDQHAQYFLAELYHLNEELKNYKLALKWYKKSAEQRHAQAQYNLGVMYYRGEGVPQDDKEAARWYRKSAEQGHAQAQYNLGNRYYEGEGVPQDYKEAARWYRKSAEQGDALAQHKLGVFYYFGEGVIEDYITAYAWLSVAKANGNEKAAESLALFRKDMSKDQIAEGQKLAREIFNRTQANRKD